MTRRAAASHDHADHRLDPNAPKRGLSAYMFFANEQRENVREENPGITFGQVGKILGERWKALNDKQRAPYEAKAAADKKRYEDEKQAYNVSATRATGRNSRPCLPARTGRRRRGGVFLDELFSPTRWAREKYQN